jgi:DtxR family Mn-dependent transcriptional regulator
MHMSRGLSETLEMYLKTILQLEREYNPVRVGHIAKARGISAASVSEAVTTLREKRLILHRPHGDVRLSAQGRRIAAEIERRHDVLFGFLHRILGVEERTAARDACDIEHVASRETMDRLEVMFEYLSEEDACRAGFVDNFKQYRRSLEQTAG